MNGDEIERARARLGRDVHRTPIVRSTTLARLIGSPAYLKVESLQKTGSFKVRGALNKLRSLDPGERARGVCTVSAGNHAQAVAYSAALEQVACTVVMPEKANSAKVAASREYGATVVLHGDGHAAFAKFEELCRERGYVPVHPFDDPVGIAGQGTVGLEIFEDFPEVKVVVVPIGGGGLIGGIASLLKERLPAITIIGVEPRGAAKMFAALERGAPVGLDRIDTIADGLAAPFVTERTFSLCRKYVDAIELVSDEEIINAMKWLLERTKLLAEPAGAASVAALLSGRIKIPAGAPVVAILSGGNADVGRLKTLF